MVALHPLIKAKALFLWDNNYRFENVNDIITPNLSNRTFMVNRNNKIILIGSPLFYPNIIGDYKRKIIDSK